MPISLGGALLSLVALYFCVQLYRNLRTNIEELLPDTSRSVRDLEEMANRVQSIDNLVILVRSNDAAAARRFVRALAERLRALPPRLVAGVHYRLGEELAFFEKRVGLYLDTGDLEHLRDYMQSRVNPFTLFPVTLDMDALIRKYAERSPIATFPDGEFATPDGTKRAVLVYLVGRRSNVHSAVELSRAVVGIVREMAPARFAPDLTVSYTGNVQIMVEEHNALVEDLAISSVVVATVVTLLIYLFFQSLTGTAALLASTFIGTLLTFGVSYFLVGYLNANTAFLGSIVLGNGINFGIIYVSRYLEERRRGRAHEEAVGIMLTGAAKPTLVAALAAGLSYGTLCLTRFRGAEQFGAIGLLGMVLCWATATVLLPCFLTLVERRLRPAYPPVRGLGTRLADRLAGTIERRPYALCAASVALTVFAIAMLPRVGPGLFETNLTRMRSRQSLERGAGFHDRTLIEIFRRHLSPIVVLAHDRADAARIGTRLEEIRLAGGAAGAIARVSWYDRLLPADQDHKRALLAEMRGLLKPRVVRGLGARESRWVSGLLSDEALRGITEADLPASLAARFADREGNAGRLVLVEPPVTGEAPLWQLEKLTAFVSELRGTADAVRPGTPVIGQQPIAADMFQAIYHVGPQATRLSMAAVVLLVVVLFRDGVTVAPILAALGLGVLWQVGLMLGFRLKINFLNFVALPITFGIGVDYAVNVVFRYRRQAAEGAAAAVRLCGGPVILASLTTIVGYCSLLMAANQALSSFGALAVLGEVTCVLAAVVTLPAWIEAIRRVRARSRPDSAPALDACVPAEPRL